jgi:hypothetical protein
MTPPDHVWLEVAGQMHLKPVQPVAPPLEVPRRAALVQWLGLAAAMLVITTGAYFVTQQQQASPASTVADGNAQALGTVEAVAEELSMATAHYEKAIGQLEALAQSSGSTLDATAAATLRDSLKTIDQAIAESRTALTQDPGSEPARDSLFEALRRKVVVLQATVSLMNEMRKGNQAGAAQAAAVAFGKTS